MFSLKGIIVPLITPMTQEGALDERGLNNLIDRMVQAGVDGIFVGGTTGEGLALSRSMRARLNTCAVEMSAGKLAVVAGIGAACMDDAVYLAEKSREAGVDALALQPPTYFPLEGEDVHAFFLHILQRVHLPLILYEIPTMTNSIPIDVCRELSRHPEVMGIKDSSNDADFFRALMQDCHGPEFSVYIGDELRAVEALEHGADGVVPSIANVHPEILVRCMEAARNGQWDAARKEQEAIARIVIPLRRKPWRDMVRWLKEQLQKEGLLESSKMSELFARSPRVVERISTGGK